MDDKPFERDPASAEDAEVPNGTWDDRRFGLKMTWKQKNCDGEYCDVFFFLLMYFKLLDGFNSIFIGEMLVFYIYIYVCV